MYPVVDMRATGVRLRQIMEMKAVTAKDIQRYLGLACVQSVYRWLGGHSLPSMDNLYALSELFQMPMDQMIVGSRRFGTISSYRAFCARMAAYERKIQIERDRAA